MPVLIVTLIFFAYFCEKSVALHQQGNVVRIIIVKKRVYSEISSLEDIKSLVSNISFHRAVTAIQFNPSRRREVHVFKGTLTDNTSAIRQIGFNAILQKKHHDFYERKIPAQLVNLELK